MLFEIINMSDPYTMEADTYEEAAMACAVLGEGAYGLEEVGGEWSMPIFIFGGINEWCEKQFGANLDACFARNKSQLPAVLRSVLIGTPAARESFNEAMAMTDDESKRQAFRENWHDKRRSSMNDIGKRAQKLAVALS